MKRGDELQFVAPYEAHKEHNLLLGTYLKVWEYVQEDPYDSKRVVVADRDDPSNESSFPRAVLEPYNPEDWILVRKQPCRPDVKHEYIKRMRDIEPVMCTAARPTPIDEPVFTQRVRQTLNHMLPPNASAASYPTPEMRRISEELCAEIERQALLDATGDNDE